MQQLLGNQVDQNNDDDSSSNEYNVDSDSGTDIGYETDITEGDADTDAVEDPDAVMMATRTTMSVISPSSSPIMRECLEYPTKYLLGEAVLPPRVIDNNGV